MTKALVVFALAALATAGCSSSNDAPQSKVAKAAKDVQDSDSTKKVTAPKSWPGKEEQDAVNLFGTPPEQSTRDIVFVHGLDGDAYSTWHPDNDPQKFFPQWIADDFKDASVWSVNYKSSSTGWTGQAMAIEERAKSLQAELRSKGIGKRPVVFIVHSLGGLIVKKIILNCHTSYDEKLKTFAKNTNGVIFFGTPHAGSEAATLSDIFARAVKVSRRTIQVEQMEKDNPMLLELSEKFQDYATNEKMPVLAFAENEKYLGVLVVSKSSADPNIANSEIFSIDGHHLSICKPVSKTRAPYTTVMEFLTEHLSRAPEFDPIDFGAFNDAFKKARDQGKLPQLTEDFVNKRVNWLGVVKEVFDAQASYSIADTADPTGVKFTASFTKQSFKKSASIGDDVFVDGTIREISVLGPILEDCKMLPLPEPVNKDATATESP